MSKWDLIPPDVWNFGWVHDGQQSLSVVLQYWLKHAGKEWECPLQIWKTRRPVSSAMNFFCHYETEENLFLSPIYVCRTTEGPRVRNCILASNLCWNRWAEYGTVTTFIKQLECSYFPEIKILMTRCSHFASFFPVAFGKKSATWQMAILQYISIKPFRIHGASHVEVGTVSNSEVTNFTHDSNPFGSIQWDQKQLGQREKWVLLFSI